VDSEDARATLVAFLARADAIMSTDAARREDLATIGSTMRVLVRVGEPHQRIERSHLPVPELLQAAVMIRPVVLGKERVNLSKVLAAAGFLVRDAPEHVRAPVADARRSLPRFLSAGRWTLMVAGPDGETRLSDVEIAELWFNAHVWHDDADKQWALRQVPEDERLICATVWVSDRVLAVRAVQQLVVDLRRAGHVAA